MALAKRLSTHGAQGCLKLHEAQKSIEPAKAAAPQKRHSRKTKKLLPSKESRSHIIMKNVGATGFEPATTCSQNRRATGLRYTPLSSHNEITSLQ